MKILVVDDNRLLATILADHLIARGHEAVAAFDGHLAEIFCDRDDYDLVVMDMVLPERDGVDVLERLREKHHRCRALVITGFSELREKESERLQRLDVTAVLEKPFSFADVDAIVERVAL
jgi:DNA-binding response OmpR family regulator